MPNYDYKCTHCGFRCEKHVALKRRALKFRCDMCGNDTMERQISAVGFNATKLKNDRER